MTYVPKGPFVDNGPPAVNAAFLNDLEAHAVEVDGDLALRDEDVAAVGRWIGADRVVVGATVHRIGATLPPGRAPVGAPLVVEVYDGGPDGAGTTLITALTVPDGSTVATEQTQVGHALHVGDIVTAKITAVGSTFAGGIPDVYLDSSTAAADVTPPTVPANPAATAAGSTQIDVSWDASTDDVTTTGSIVYDVQRAPDASGSPGTWATVHTTAAGVTSWSDSGRGAATAYHYRVRAVDEAGNPSGWSAEVTATTDAAPGAARFPGDPKVAGVDKVLWGSSIQGNGDPAKHETPTGLTLALRRRFWSTWPGDVAVPGPLVSAVQADHAAGRLPFVSFKVPSWATAAAGGYDTEFDALIAELESYAKPTWLVMNHEPENDGGAAADWRGAQQRFRDRMTAYGTINRIAFCACLMAYTWNQYSGRNPEDWWLPGVWDIYTVDHYTEPDKDVLRQNHWGAFQDWITGKGIPFALGEWGLRQDSEDPDNVAQMQAFFDASASDAQWVGYSYFDSSANSTGTGWELRESDQLTARFRTLMGDARAVDLADLGY